MDIIVKLVSQSEVLNQLMLAASSDGGGGGGGTWRGLRGMGGKEAGGGKCGKEEAGGPSLERRLIIFLPWESWPLDQTIQDSGILWGLSGKLGSAWLCGYGASSRGAPAAFGPIGKARFALRSLEFEFGAVQTWREVRSRVPLLGVPKNT